MTETIEGRALLSIPEFCKIASVGRSTVYEEMSGGRLRSVQVGRRRLIPAAEVRRWLETIAKAGAGEVPAP